jgi:hypothetical protein
MRSAKSHATLPSAEPDDPSSSSAALHKAPRDPSRWSLLNPNRQPLNPSRDLLGRLLHTVQLQLQEDLEAVTVPRGTEVDLVFSGGGIRGYYVCGASTALDTLVEKHDLKIRRLAGASAGAWCAVFIACGVHPLDWADTYYESSSRRDFMLLDAYRKFIPTMMEKILPADAWQRCSGRVYISITRFSLHRGFENVVVSEFSSNADLFAACLASSTIPLLSTRNLVSRFRGWVALDGGLTNNLPTFDNSSLDSSSSSSSSSSPPPVKKRRQLVFDMRGVAYPFALTLSAKDFCIESLILRGAVEFRLFLLGLSTTSTHGASKVIFWASTNGRDERYSFLGVAAKLARGAALCFAGAWVVRHYVPALAPVALKAQWWCPSSCCSSPLLRPWLRPRQMPRPSSSSI